MKNITNVFIPNIFNAKRPKFYILYYLTRYCQQGFSILVVLYGKQFSNDSKVLFCLIFLVLFTYIQLIISKRLFSSFCLHETHANIFRRCYFWENPILIRNVSAGNLNCKIELEIFHSNMYYIY